MASIQKLPTGAEFIPPYVWIDDLRGLLYLVDLYTCFFVMFFFLWEGRDEITIVVGKVQVPHATERPPSCEKRSVQILKFDGHRSGDNSP